MQISINYGSEKISFTIPDDNMIEDHPFIAPRKLETTPEMDDIEGQLTNAISNPVSSPRLKDIVTGKIVAFVVSDEFRAGQHQSIIHSMLSEIALGKPSHVRVFCATGSHDKKFYAKRIEEWVNHSAAALKLSFEFVANDCDERGAFIEIGKCSDGTPIDVRRSFLECEVRAYGHEGKHHYMCGYSNIDKQVLPGISSRRSIEGNHINALDDRLSVGGRSVWASDPARRDNPFSIGASEARALADSSFIDADGKLVRRKVPTFGLDMISDTKHVYWAMAGDTSEISLEMTKRADAMSAFFVEPAQYVIISPGGPPASQALYGTQNCFDLALAGAVVDGGEALIVAPLDGRADLPKDVCGLAPDKKSKELFWDNLTRLIKLPIAESTAWIKNNFELYLWKTDRVLKLMKKRNIKVYVYSKLPDEVLIEGGFIPVHDVQSWIGERAALGVGKFRAIDDGNKILVMKR